MSHGTSHVSNPTSFLSRFPVLRILLPFVLGVVLSRYGVPGWLSLILASLGVSGYVALLALSRSPDRRYAMRPLFVVPVFLVALSLGLATERLHRPTPLDVSSLNGRELTVRVNDVTYSDFSMSIDASFCGQPHGVSHLLLTTRGCDYTLRAGDVLSIPGCIEEVTNNGNPDEIDYRQYLADKGIVYCEHIDVREIRKTGHTHHLASHMSDIRRQLQSLIFASKLSPPVQNFVVALIVGNKRFLDDSTRESFSQAGVAHVLALSGLHMGIITLLLWWLLLPLDYCGHSKLRLVVTLVAVMAFVWFTGASPSVVRAAIMVAFSFAGLMFFRRNHPLNALFVAILLILFFMPQSLWSVGFQLSVVTVSAILLLVPSFTALRSRLLAYVVGTVVTSAVCMMTTMALTAYYFHSISLLSVIANLLLLPLLPVFMVLAAVFVVLCAIGLEWPLVNTLLTWCHSIFTQITQWLAGLSFSHVDNIYVTAFAVWAYFVLLFLVWLWIGRRKRRAGLLALAVLLVMIAHNWWVSASTPRSGLVLFNTYNATPIMRFDNHHARLWIPDNDDYDLTAFKRQHVGFLAHYGITSLEMEDHPTATLDHGCVHLGEYVIVTRRFRKHVDKLQEFLGTRGVKQIVLSGDIYYKDLARLTSELDSVGLPYHSMKRDGAIAEYK